MDFLHDWVIGGQGFLENLAQWRTPLLNYYFLAIAFLGQEEFFLIAPPAIYWLYNKQIGRRLAYLLMLGTWTNEALKNIFRVPRPPLEIALVEEVGYGLPSGHAQLSVMLWGYAGWSLRRAIRWLPALALWLIASISFSRLYLAVHYPADVLAGLLIGLIFLWASLWVEPRLAGWYSRLSSRQVTALAVILSVLALVVMPSGGRAWPVENASTEAGLILGALIGFDREKRQVGFAVAGSPAQKIGRYLIGLFLLVLVWAGLRALFGAIDGGHLIESSLRVVRYALIGLTISWWLPALFVRLGLASTE